MQEDLDLRVDLKPKRGAEKFSQPGKNFMFHFV